MSEALAVYEEDIEREYEIPPFPLALVPDPPELPTETTALDILGQKYERHPIIDDAYPWLPEMADRRSWHTIKTYRRPEIAMSEKDYKIGIIRPRLTIPEDLEHLAEQIDPFFDYLLNKLKWPVFSEEEAAQVEEMHKNLEYGQRIYFTPVNVREIIKSIPADETPAVLEKLTTLDWGHDATKLILHKTPAIAANYPGGIPAFLDDLDRISKPAREEAKTRTACATKWTENAASPTKEFQALIASPVKFAKFLKTGVRLADNFGDSAAPYFQGDMYNPSIDRWKSPRTFYNRISRASQVFCYQLPWGAQRDAREYLFRAYLKYYGDPHFEDYLEGFKTLVKRCDELEEELTTPERNLGSSFSWKYTIQNYLLMLPEAVAPADPQKPLKKHLLPDIHFVNHALILAEAGFRDDPNTGSHYSFEINHNLRQGQTLEEAATACGFVLNYDEKGTIQKIGLPSAQALYEEAEKLCQKAQVYLCDIHENATHYIVRRFREAEAEFLASLKKLEKASSPENRAVEDLKSRVYGGGMYREEKRAIDSFEANPPSPEEQIAEDLLEKLILLSEQYKIEPSDELEDQIYELHTAFEHQLEKLQAQGAHTYHLKRACTYMTVIRKVKERKDTRFWKTSFASALPTKKAISGPVAPTKTTAIIKPDTQLILPSSDWIHQVNPATRMAVLGGAMDLSIQSIMRDPAEAPRLQRESTRGRLTLSKIRQLYHERIQATMPLFVPIVEQQVRTARRHNPALMPVGSKVHTKKIHRAAFIKVLEIFNQFGIDTTFFSLDNMGNTLVNPALPTGLEQQLLIRLFAIFELIKSSDPQFQICIAGRWSPETAAIFGSAMLLTNNKVPNYQPGCWQSTHNNQTGSHIMSFDARCMGVKKTGIPGDLPAAIGRTDMIAQNDRTIFDRGPIVGTAASHSDYQGPFAPLFAHFRDRYLLALKDFGLDETIMEATWVFQHAEKDFQDIKDEKIDEEKKQELIAKHEAMIEKILHAWAANPELVERIEALINELEAMFLEKRDNIITSDPQEFHRREWH
jgi:hypothetical protein